jgi:hypothetical protein
MRQTKYWRWTNIILAAMVFGQACARGEGFRATTTTERGIPVILNPRHPLHKKASLKLVPEFVLSGRTEGGGPFSSVDSFAVGRDGTVFVCDERAALIKIFDGRGQALGSIPTARPEMGELANPRIVGTTSPGELVVESSGHAKLDFYSRDGRFLRTTSLAAINTFRLGINSRGDILIHLYRYARPNMLYYLRVYDSSLKEIKTLGQYWEPMSFGNDFYAYLPILWWVIDSRDGVVYGYPQKYELEVFGPDASPLRIIRKEQTPIPITEDEKEAYRKEYAKAPYLRFHFPAAHSAFQKFTVDERGWIYVMTWERAAGGEGFWYDVFDEKGIYTARIALSEIPRLWAGGRLYTLDKDASGEFVLTRNTYEWLLR